MSLAQKLAKVILEDPPLRSVFDAMKKSDRFSEELVLFVTKPAAKKLGMHVPAGDRREAARILLRERSKKLATVKKNSTANTSKNTANTSKNTANTSKNTANTSSAKIPAGTFDALRKSR